MNGTIVILLMLLILFCLMRTNRNINIATKEKEIVYLEEKLRKAKNNAASDGISIFSLLVVLLLDGYIIYLSASAILSFVK